MDFERRSFAEVRAAGRMLFGTAAPYNRPADLGAFRETLMPGAFRATLAKGNDVLAVVNHNVEQLLGRTRSGTLRLSETDAGLQYELQLPPTSLGNDVLALAERGDLSGMSFAFVANRELWPTPRTRQLHAISISEISVLTGPAPAYANTSIALRSRDAQRGAGRDLLQRLRIAIM